MFAVHWAGVGKRKKKKKQKKKLNLIENVTVKISSSKTALVTQNSVEMCSCYMWNLVEN